MIDGLYPNLEEAQRLTSASLAATNMMRDDYRKSFHSIVASINEICKTKSPEKFAEESALLRQIIAAILAGHPARAGAAIRQHLKRASKHVMTLGGSTFIR